MRGLRQHLPIHERRVNPAQNRHRLGCGLAGDFKHAFGLVDRGRDRGAADDIGGKRGNARAQLVLPDVVRHRVDEMDIVVACGPQRPGEIGHPGGRPVSRDLGTAGMVIGVDQNQSHVSLLCQLMLTVEASRQIDMDQIRPGTPAVFPPRRKSAPRAPRDRCAATVCNRLASVGCGHPARRASPTPPPSLRRGRARA